MQSLGGMYDREMPMVPRSQRHARNGFGRKVIIGYFGFLQTQTKATEKLLVDLFKSLTRIVFDDRLLLKEGRSRDEIVLSGVGVPGTVGQLSDRLILFVTTFLEFLNI